MRILLVNDDGVYSPGIYALAKALKADGNEIQIVAPQTERTGAGHSMTMFGPIEIFDVTLPGLEDVPTYAISGTPVDCVKVGAGYLFERPDFIYSGINTGTNLGCDIYGSGTVNAAATAVEKNIPTIAISIAANKPKHLDVAGEVAVHALHNLYPKVADRGTLLSINVPDTERSEIKGIKVTEIARANPDYPYNEFISPRKHRWYWDAAAALNLYEPDEDVDERWLREGYITVTPIKFDIVDRDTLKLLKDIDVSGLL